MQFKRRSIFNRLVLAFIAVGMMTGVPLVMLAIEFNKESSARRVEQSVTQQMAIIAESFEQEFSVGLLRSLKQIAESDALGNYLSASVEAHIVSIKALETNLLRLQKEYEVYSGIYYADAEGTLIVKVVDAQRSLEPGSIGAEAKPDPTSGETPTHVNLVELFANIRTTPLLLSAGNMEWFMPPREVSIQGPFVDENGRLSFLAGMPLLDYDSGGFGGVVFIRVRLDGFAKLLASVKFFDESPMWLYSRDGRNLIRPPESDDILDPSKFLPGKHSKALLIQRADKGLIASRDLEIVKDKPFIRVAYAIPSSAISKDYQSAIYFFMAVLALVLVAVCALAFAVSRKFSKPIIELANAASRLAEGEQVTQVSVHATGEIQVLVNSFNEMSRRLQSANQNRASAFAALRNTVTQMRSDHTPLPLQPGELAEMPGGEGIAPALDESEDLQAITQVIDNLIHEREENLRNVQSAKESAVEASRAKGDFLATMSHEIRTPLNAVIGLSDILGTTQLTPEQRHLVKTMESAGGQLLQIINDVLDFSRLQSGRIELTDSVVELSTFVNRLMLMIGGLPDATRLDIRSTIEPDVPERILADDARLMQILTNLLGNAVKFTPQGEVRIAVSVAQDLESRPVIRFAVTDTGPGIQEDLRNRIFEPFTQGVAERLRPHAGSGLGLAICRRLTEAMGGSLELVETGGKGACFVLSLPLKTIAQGQSEQHQESERDGETRPLRILVAEDTPANQLVIQLILKGMGHSVRLTANGQEAVDAFLEEPFDAVLLDIQMPVMDGYEAARRIRAAGPAGETVVIVALTAFTQDSDRDKARACGVTDFASKPIRSKDIVKLIARNGLGSAGRRAD